MAQPLNLKTPAHKRYNYQTRLQKYLLTLYVQLAYKQQDPENSLADGIAYLNRSLDKLDGVEG